MGERVIQLCLTCKWFRAQEDSSGGQCFRYPPTPAMQVSFDGSGACHFENVRPYVQGEEFCGEWAAAIEAQRVRLNNARVRAAMRRAARDRNRLTANSTIQREAA